MVPNYEAIQMGMIAGALGAVVSGISTVTAGLGGLSGIGSVIGAVGSVFSAFSGASAMESSGQASAAAYMYNAQIAQQNAQAVQAQQARDVERQKRLNLASEATLTSQLQGRGYLLEGTPLLIIKEQQEQGNEKVGDIVRDAQMQKANYLNAAGQNQYLAQQAIKSANDQADSMRTTGLFKAGASLLG